MNDKGKKVKILWNDAKLFSPKNEEIGVSIMETMGLLELEKDEYFVVKNPLTKNTKTGKRHPEKDPTFYFIPKRLVIKTDYL